MFHLGLDLGQASDYTALCVLEQVAQGAPVPAEPVIMRTRQLWRDGLPIAPAKPARVPAHYHVRHLQRYPLGTAYPAIVTSVAEMLARPEMRGSVLVVDATGVGRPVLDMFTAAQLKPVAVTITGGSLPTEVKPGWFNVPKRDLVSTLQVLLQSERLKIAAALPDAAVLTQELLNFRVTISESANDRYEGRSGSHDDLVLAVALAAWYAEGRPKKPVYAEYDAFSQITY